jgi:hypothetical protein
MFGGVLGSGNVEVTNCYWNREAQNSEGTKNNAVDNRATPYDGRVNESEGFPDVSAVSGWETSTNGANGSISNHGYLKKSSPLSAKPA